MYLRCSLQKKIISPYSLFVYVPKIVERPHEIGSFRYTSWATRGLFLVP